MKKKFKNTLIAIVVIYVIGVIVSMVRGYDIVECFSATPTLLILGVGILGVLVYFVSTNRNWFNDKDGYTGKTQSGREMDQHYEARFVTEQELLTNPVFMPTTWRQLPKVKKSGIMIRSLYKKIPLKLTWIISSRIRWIAL